MQYSVVSILILIRLIYQVAGQGGPTPSTSSTPTPSTSSTPTPSTTGTPATPDPNNPTSTTPDPNNPPCPPSDGTSPTPPPGTSPTPPPGTSPSPPPGTSPTPPPGTSPSPPPGTSPSPPSGTSPSGGGTDNLPCIKNILQLCEAYQFAFNKVSEEYGCTMFTNPYLFAFHTNLVEADMECDTIMQLEVMRQNVMTNKGQPGPSTHSF